MKAPRFSYVRAESLEHALQLLAEHGDDARILAGGQSLMPVLNMRLAQPRLLIDINRIEALRGISFSDGIVRIGALARHAEVMNSPIVAQRLPLIAEAMPHLAHVAVRNRGTFGGSIALADPAAEMPACILALGAQVVVESTRGRRAIAADGLLPWSLSRPRAGRMSFSSRCAFLSRSANMCQCSWSSAAGRAISPSPALPVTSAATSK